MGESSVRESDLEELFEGLDRKERKEALIYFFIALSHASGLSLTDLRDCLKHIIIRLESEKTALYIE